LKKSIKQKICIAALGLMLTSGFIPVCAFAASSLHHQESAGIQVAEDTKEYDAVSFSARIQALLDAWHKDRNSILSNSEHSALATSETLPADKIDKISQVVDAPSPEQSDNKPLPAPVSQQSSYCAETFDFDWQGTPLSQTLYAIAKIAGKRVVINANLSGNVYTALPGVTYDQALNYLASVYNFNWMLDEDGNTILISTSDLMKQTKVFTIRYADKEKLKDNLKAMGIDEKSIAVNDETGSITVTATPYQLNQANRMISGMDKPISQCLIIAQLIEITHGRDLDLGMEYTLPTYTHTADSSTTNTMAGKFIDKLTFGASAQANKTLSKGKVIARPMIMTKNGQEAAVYMGDSVPYQSTTTTSSSTSVSFEYKDVGTSLKITPIINEVDNQIRLNVNAEVSNITKWTTSGTAKAPQVSTRKANTMVTIKSGQSFVIGGLMSSEDLDNLSGIPGLMDLPILGSLFRYHSVTKENTEIYIMITPYIVGNDTDPETLLKGVKEHAK
jgi:type II secretory pathway component GspD/PulD (secretin)